MGKLLFPDLLGYIQQFTSLVTLQRRDSGALKVRVQPFMLKIMQVNRIYPYITVCAFRNIDPTCYLIKQMSQLTKFYLSFGVLFRRLENVLWIDHSHTMTIHLQKLYKTSNLYSIRSSENKILLYEYCLALKILDEMTLRDMITIM